MLLFGRIATPRNRRVALTLQIAGDYVTDHLRRAAVVLILQVALNHVAENRGCGRVVLHLEIAMNLVARTRWWSADLNSGSIVLELQVAVDGRTANLVLFGAGTHVLNLEIALDNRTCIDGERVTGDLYVPVNGAAVENQVAAVQHDIPLNRGVGENQSAAVQRDVAANAATTNKLAALAVRDGHIAIESTVIGAVAGCARSRSCSRNRHRREQKSMPVTGEIEALRDDLPGIIDAGRVL